MPCGDSDTPAKTLPGLRLCIDPVGPQVLRHKEDEEGLILEGQTHKWFFKDLPQGQCGEGWGNIYFLCTVFSQYETRTSTETWKSRLCGICSPWDVPGCNTCLLSTTTHLFSAQMYMEMGSTGGLEPSRTAPLLTRGGGEPTYVLAKLEHHV